VQVRLRALDVGERVGERDVFREHPRSLGGVPVVTVA
jgi:hypothetical protein